MSRAEINWIPLSLNGELYITYSIDPLRVLNCDTNSGDCKFVYEQPDASKHPFKYAVDHLRGGTPWILYQYPYYISLGHSVVIGHSPGSKDHSIYNAHFMVLCVEPWRIVYVSRHLEFSSEWMTSVPVVRNYTISTPFFYPSGIIKWSDDVLDVSGHLNDYNGHVLRIKGVKNLMDDVIQHDAKHGANLTGANVRTVQQYIIEELKDSRPDFSFNGDMLAETS